MWFGTEAGLAKFDGRRTQTIPIIGLAPGRVLALQSDADGALWIGTETGAARLVDGRFEVITEINGHPISAIITPERGRALLASEQGNIFDCRIQPDGSRRTEPLLTQQLQSADRDAPGPLLITSLMMVNQTLFAGSFSRGVLTIADGQAREIETKPTSFFVRAMAADPSGKLWIGLRVKKDEPALLTGWEVSKVVRNETADWNSFEYQNNWERCLDGDRRPRRLSFLRRKESPALHLRWHSRRFTVRSCLHDFSGSRRRDLVWHRSRRMPFRSERCSG